MTELNHLKVIVLRSPRHDDPLAALISARGGRVHSLPVQKITPLADDDGSITSKIERIDNYQKAIFVSRNAAFFALRWLDHCGLSFRPKGQCFAIGPTTAAALESRGIEVEIPSHQWSSEGLLALPAMVHVRGERVIIFRGQGGLPTLREGLVERGALVEYCELYQRQRDDTFENQIIDLLARAQPCVLVAHSGSVLDALLAPYPIEHQQIILASPLIVPGIRLQQYAQTIGFKEVIVAASALAKDIECALSGWYTRIYSI
ncbi:MAG: uroporphyrinogen-III synthase [Porticoccaceae bacterium]|nr:uroporphyrinogen-III synthase [Porticoccaceae bacterium]